MSLDIYSAPDQNSKISSGTFLSPLTITLDGVSGGAITKKLYVRNDDITRWYGSIAVTPVDISNGWLVNGTHAFKCKISLTNILPTFEEWLEITAGGTDAFAYNIGSTTYGDISTYLPFWVYMEIPRNEVAATIRSITLRLSATENLVI